MRLSKLSVFVRWEVSSLVSSVEPKIVATRAESSDRCFVVFFIPQKRVSSSSAFPRWFLIPSQFHPALTRIKNVSPGILISVFSPFFLSSFWCLCWNPTPQKDVLPRLNSKYFFNEYWCAWLHFLSSYWNPIYPHHQPPHRPLCHLPNTKTS